jgi:hypothetical protein
MVDNLAELAHETGIVPSQAALESGIEQHLKRYPWSPVVNPTTLSEIKRQFGVSVRREVFDQIYHWFATKNRSDISIADYRAILSIAKVSGVPPGEDLLKRVISRISSEGVRAFDEHLGTYGSWIIVDGNELLEQFRRLEQGLPVDDKV